MNLRTIIIILTAMSLSSIGVTALAAMLDTSAAQQAGSQAPPPSQLQVTGSSKQFSVLADHADLLSTLKAVFVQAGKQFDSDPGVAGRITLKIDNQAFETVLDSICRQTFVKYNIDSNTGVYHVAQDTAAIKAAFSRLNSLNIQLRQQLRDLGLEMPDDAKLGTVLEKRPDSAPELSTSNNRAAGARGGFGGAAGNAPGGRAQGGDAQSPLSNQQTKSALGAPPSAAATGVKDQPGRQQGAAQYRDAYIDTGNLPPDVVERLLQAYGLTSVDTTSPAVDRAFAAYLKQNNLVAVNTKGAAAAVSDIFAELSKQSGVPILLDPMVPRGQKFRITMNLPACTLNEALNLIAPPAKLRWFTLNGSIYITPTPEFQIFYGSAPIPYVIYGNNALRSQQNGVQAPGPNGSPPVPGSHP